MKATQQPTTELDRISPESYSANQTIIASLKNALSTYKKSKLDASFVKAIVLPSGFAAWVTYDTKFSKSYRIHVYHQNSRNQGGSNATHNYYAGCFETSITVVDYAGNFKTDWREQLEAELIRFDRAEQYKYEEARLTILPEIESLASQAYEIKSRAEALVLATKQKAGYSPDWMPDYDMQKAFAHLFNYKG